MLLLETPQCPPCLLERPVPQRSLSGEASGQTYASYYALQISKDTVALHKISAMVLKPMEECIHPDNCGYDQAASQVCARPLFHVGGSR